VRGDMGDQGMDRHLVEAAPPDRLRGQEQPPVHGRTDPGHRVAGLPVAQYAHGPERLARKRLLDGDAFGPCVQPVADPVMLGHRYGHLEEGLDLGLGQAPEIHLSEFVHFPLDHPAGLRVSPAQAARQDDDPGRREGESDLVPRAMVEVERQAGRDPERE
jgi:hypothetical protein